MKKIFLLLTAVFMLLGCKKDNWMDWKTQNELWLEQNLANDPDIKVTESGLQYKILHMGVTSDAKPQQGSVVYCDYTGKLINGYRFDSSKNAQMSMNVGTGGIIKGFYEGLKKIHVHGDIILYIPWDLAYGEEGVGSEGSSSFIPPYSTLIFTIHLCAIE
ncbi:MAG: FKBP-type peptidyl-prolyl cis-trans isomerase [Paludibacteraceae bacterium]|nr:FKBP-type peptidyl-prolyl cis-trans isomerase [Paludibacteraceae bacterium]